MEPTWGPPGSCRVLSAPVGAHVGAIKLAIMERMHGWDTGHYPSILLKLTSRVHTILFAISSNSHTSLSPSLLLHVIIQFSYLHMWNLLANNRSNSRVLKQLTCKMHVIQYARGRTIDKLLLSPPKIRLVNIMAKDWRLLRCQVKMVWPNKTLCKYSDWIFHFARKHRSWRIYLCISRN